MGRGGRRVKRQETEKMRFESGRWKRKGVGEEGRLFLGSLF